MDPNYKLRVETNTVVQLLTELSKMQEYSPVLDLIPNYCFLETYGKESHIAQQFQVSKTFQDKHKYT